MPCGCGGPAAREAGPVAGDDLALFDSDGLANQGITDPDRLAGLVQAAATEGIGTSCFGVGEGFNEELLGAMADAAGRECHFLEQADAAAAVFATELGDLVALAAQNVSVEVRPHADVEWLGVLNDYPSTAAVGCRWRWLMRMPGRPAPVCCGWGCRRWRRWARS